MARAPKAPKGTVATPRLAITGMVVKRRVTVPLKNLQTGEEFYFKVEGELAGGEHEEGRPGFDKAMTVCPVIDLQTGESITLIVPTVLQSALKRTPGGYVGKSFLAQKGAKAAGKRYHTIELFELEAGK